MFFFSFQTQRIFEITIREVGEVQPQDYSYVQLLNILVRKVMEKMELAQVDRHYFDPNAAIYLKEYKLELWVSEYFLISTTVNFLVCISGPYTIFPKF